MSSSGEGMLCHFLKEAGIVSTTARGVGNATAAIGRGVWDAAGHIAPHPAARAGLLATAALATGSQVPEVTARIGHNARFVRGEVPTPAKGF